jgi:hypothetical protein
MGISRLLRAMDDNVDIVYITCSEIPTEVLAYMVKILELSQITDIVARLHLIHIDNVQSL